jgi:hypothetical protein
VAESRSSSPGTIFLIAGAILVTGILVVARAPLAGCPECEGGRIAVVTEIETRKGDGIAGCTTCGDKTRVPLLKKWTHHQD